MSELDHSLNVSDWLSQTEGKLSVDVVETQDEIVVRSAIAGVRTQDLDITLSDDTLTIRGVRNHACEESTRDQVHVQECHWGSFSRTIILPCSVDADSVDATLRRGILTIHMKKVEMDKSITVLELDDL
ncbi:MAG: Hsp20/alpha crystallin family protein [Patescibacteria group bacterium]